MTVQNPRSIAGVFRSGGSRSDSGGLAELSNSASLLDSPIGNRLGVFTDLHFRFVFSFLFLHLFCLLHVCC